MQIVTRQISGLGNQLFQYAAGRYYATRYDARLSVSIDQPQNAMSHGYCASVSCSAHFCIRAPAAPTSRLEQLYLFQKTSAQAGSAWRSERALGIQTFTEDKTQQFTFLEDLSSGTGYTRVSTSPAIGRRIGSPQKVEADAAP